jgi:hypothetical protein
MRRQTTGSRDDLSALIAELADLHGRAMEINSGIARENQLLADTQQRMIMALAKIAQTIAAPPPSAPAAAPEPGRD